MNTIQTKYAVGDVVYYATTRTTRKQHPCPDCRGEKKWKAISPAGGEYKIRCPRCGSRYLSDQDISLDYTAHEPETKKLTIGSVRVDTNDKERPVSYMCAETGVGSGAIYSEEYLHPDEQSAQVHAQALAAQYNSKTPWIVKQYNKSLDVCDYELENAALKCAQDKNIHRRTKLEVLFSDIRDCETIDEVFKTIDKFDWGEE